MGLSTTVSTGGLYARGVVGARFVVAKVQRSSSGNDSVDQLRRYGLSVEEYTPGQPTDSKYDYLHSGRPPITVVVVILDDRIYGVYRIVGIEAEGTNYSIVSNAYQALETGREIPVVQCRRFGLQRISSLSIGPDG